MKLLTKVGAGAVVVATVAVAGGLQAPGVRERFSNSSAMAMPKRAKLVPGRAIVQIQLCYMPPGNAALSAGWILGGREGVDHVGAPTNCLAPWQRSATLDPGARVALGWTVAVGPVARTKYRIIVNNRVRINGEDGANQRLYACVVGTPPCELP